MNEIHELGLMYLHYEIVLSGYKSIYLGESMPIESLKELKKHFDSIIYVSFFTVQPDRGVINEYVQQMTDELLDDKTQLWLTGRLVEFFRPCLSEQITVYNSIKELTVLKICLMIKYIC
jgi:hypothetical protein